MILESDIIIDGFHSNTLKKLGIDFKELYNLNPRLIFLSLPGYASSDLDKQNIKAWEGIILADCGVFSDMGLNRTLMGIKTSYSSLPLASIYGAIIGNLSVLSALYAREIHGYGDIIEVPLSSALLDCLVYNSWDIGNIHERYKCIRERVIEEKQKKNLPMNLSYDKLDKLLDAFFRTYFCSNGRPIYLVAPSHFIHQKRCLEILGLYDQMIECGLPIGNVYSSSEEWPEKSDCILGTYPISSHYWNTKLTEEMKKAFMTKTSFEWEHIFGKNKIPLSAIRTTREWINSDHAINSGLTIELQNEYGTMKQMGKNLWLKPLNLSNHTEIKKNRPIYTKHPKTPFLKSIKVLDLSNVIAGPTIASVLSRFGAEIIKIDPVNPSYDALITVLLGIPANRGKKSILLDLKKHNSKEIFSKLVKWADIININQITPQLENIGATPDMIKSINPDIIIMRFDAFGGSEESGELSNNIGYDDLLQASTGIMYRFGGSIDTPEEHAHLGTIDVVSGFSGAAACCLALYYREKTNNTSIARTSLAAGAITLQVPYYFDYPNRKSFSEPKGRHVLGEHILYRWYHCNDGNIFIACSGTKKDILNLTKIHFLNKYISSILNFDIDDIINNNEISNNLQQIFNKYDCQTIINELNKYNISAIRQGFLSEHRKNNTIPFDDFHIGKLNSSLQWIDYKNHPLGNNVVLFSPSSIKPYYSEIINPISQPKYGIDTINILTQMGFSSDEINIFLNNNIIGISWSNSYCPPGNPWK